MLHNKKSLLFLRDHRKFCNIMSNKQYQKESYSCLIVLLFSGMRWLLSFVCFLTLLLCNKKPIYLMSIDKAPSLFSWYMGLKETSNYGWIYVPAYWDIWHSSWEEAELGMQYSRLITIKISSLIKIFIKFSLLQQYFQPFGSF